MNQHAANYRFEPVFTISIDSLLPEHRNMEYLAEKIIYPVMSIWETQGIKMSRTVLQGQSVQVNDDASWSQPATSYLIISLTS